MSFTEGAARWGGPLRPSGFRGPSARFLSCVLRTRLYTRLCRAGQKPVVMFSIGMMTRSVPVVSQARDEMGWCIS